MSVNDKPILAKGVIGAFKAALQELYKLALLLNGDDELLKEVFDNSEAIGELKQILVSTDLNSTENEYSYFFESLRKMPDVTYEIVEMHCDQNSKDMCKGFKRLQELLEEKLSTDSKTWFEMKQKAKEFPKTYAKCQEEAAELQQQLETEINKQEKMSEHVSEGKSQRLIFSAKDFKSLLPSQLKANTEDKIEFIERFSEEKLSHLRIKQEESEKKLKEASSKYNSELWKIIEETMKTKAFLEWLKIKNEGKVKNLDEKRSFLWNKFNSEMEECRELCKTYKEVDTAYVNILNEKREKEIQKKRVSAAIIIQALIRGFLARKRAKKTKELQQT